MAQATPQTRVQQVEQVQKATPVADPGPLGLCGFGLTTFVLSIVNANVLTGAGDVKIVIGLAVFYGGIAQLLAGMWEFRNGNTFGATAFTSYGAFWLSFAALLIPGFGVGLGSATGATDHAVGYYLLGWTIFTAILMIATFRISGALSAVFVLLTLTFLFLTIGKLGDNTGIGQLGGWFGVLTALAAWYTAAATLLKNVITLPTFPLAARS